MQKVILSLIIIFLVSGCYSIQERRSMMAEQRQNEMTSIRHYCSSLGFKYGTDAMAGCVHREDIERKKRNHANKQHRLREQHKLINKIVCGSYKCDYDD